MVEGSILDAPLLRKMMQGVRWVYHLAADPHLWARNKASFHQINFEGPCAVLQAARVDRNPRTGEEVPIFASRVVVFEPAQKFKHRVNHSKGPHTDLIE